MENWNMVISLTALFCTGITATFSILAYAKVVGLQNSTHKMEFVPMPSQMPATSVNPDAQYGEDLLKGFAGDNMEIKQPK